MIIHFNLHLRCSHWEKNYSLYYHQIKILQVPQQKKNLHAGRGGESIPVLRFMLWYN